MQESEKCLNRIQVNYVYHYSDAMMGTMASQITNLMIVYSTVYSGAGQRKHQSSASSAFVGGRGDSPVTGEFSAQRASNAENVPLMTSSWCCYVASPVIQFFPYVDFILGLSLNRIEQDVNLSKKKRSLFLGA